MNKFSGRAIWLALLQSWRSRQRDGHQCCRMAAAFLGFSLGLASGGGHVFLVDCGNRCKDARCVFCCDEFCRRAGVDVVPGHVGHASIHFVMAQFGNSSDAAADASWHSGDMGFIEHCYLGGIQCARGCADTHVCMYVCMCVTLCSLCNSFCMHARMHACMYICMHAGLYVCMCVCMHACIHA